MNIKKLAVATMAYVVTMIAGLLIYTVMGFATAAKMRIEPVGEFLAYHTAFQFVQFLLTGAALGLIYGRRPEQGA
jgi:hypothetical protein